MSAIEYMFPHFNGDITVTPAPDGIHSSFAGWYWNPESFGGMDVNPQPGDILIAVIMTRTDAISAYFPYHRVIDDAGHERTDWTTDMDILFDNDSTGFPDVPHPEAGFFAMTTFSKVWREEDDPATYDAYFTGYNNLVGDDTGFSAETNMAMCCVHSGDGNVTFEGTNEITTGFDVAADATFERNFGDGVSSWGWVEPSEAEQTDAFGTWGFYPGAGWGYYSCTGLNVYFFGAFGKWAFFLNADFDVGVEGWFFHPADSVDYTDDAFGVSLPTSSRGPEHSFTLGLLDVLATGVRASRRPSQIHSISVT